jgi:PRC-barrel domain
MQTIKRLQTCTVVTTDGRIGRLRTLYFDDRRWILRHLVVTLRHWLAVRDVLVPPDCVRRIDTTSRRLVISLNKHEVARKPEAWTDRPVSQQRETSINAVYWYSVFPGPLAPRSVGHSMIGPRRRDDRHLRSTAEVLGYYVHARDDEIGHLADFLVDDTASRIQYAVVDTRNWWPGKHVLVPVEWITWVSWGAATVYVNLARSVIRNAPTYDPHHPITPRDESALVEYYGRPKRRDTDVRWVQAS